MSDYVIIESVPDKCIRRTMYHPTNKWESYSNIHPEFGLLDMGQTHTFSLKIDGSNLSIHIKFDPENNEWRIVCLYGRTAPVWTADSGEPYSDIKYGSAGSLGDLPDKLTLFSITVAEQLGIQEIIIYGEAFRASKAKYASWHPFGYKLPSKNFELHMMTSDLHMLFSSCCEQYLVPVQVLSTNDEFLDFLRVQTATTIFPPPLLYFGRLGSGIRKLYPILMTRDPNFEGLFIVNEEGTNGFKWKTPIHEAQLKIRTSTELDLLPNTEAFDVYELLLQVCAMCPKAQSKAQSNNQSNSMMRSDEQLNMRTRVEIADAFTNIRNKSPCFEHKSTRERNDVVTFFLPLVVDEVLSHYEDSGVTHHMDKDKLERLTRSVITPLIMRA